jgi:hypothetical protein
MTMPIETEMSDNALALAASLRTLKLEGDGALELQQRAKGEFLRKLVLDLQPMLRESMRSHCIRLASDGEGTIALKSDGVFVHVGIAGQQDALAAHQVLRAQPSLRSILNCIEDEFLSVGDVQALRAAEIVCLARYLLSAPIEAPFSDVKESL